MVWFGISCGHGGVYVCRDLFLDVFFVYVCVCLKLEVRSCWVWHDDVLCVCVCVCVLEYMRGSLF